MLMVALLALSIVFWVDVTQYMKHIDANGVVDPEYESPTTTVVAIMTFITFIVLIFFIADLIVYFNVKKRLKKTGNNIEISVKSDDEKVNKALDETKTKFMTAGLVADVNTQTSELDVEYAYKINKLINTKETVPLFLYILYKPLGIGLLALILMCVALNMIFNINNPKDAILPIIISVAVSFLIIILFFIFLVVRANNAKKKAVEYTKEIGMRIYADHLEQYNIVTKDNQEAEIRYKVPFLKMKHLETKRAFYCRGYNNGQVVALRLDKSDMPEEALILIKNKLEK
jgi:hypothetical protein